MLADFQQALADLTASPELCISARLDPPILREKYRLTEREWARLVGIVPDFLAPAPVPVEIPTGRTALRPWL